MSHYTDQNPISEQAWMESVMNQLGVGKIYESMSTEEKLRSLSSGKEKEIIDKFNELRLQKPDREYYDDYVIFKMAFRMVTGKYPERADEYVELKMSGETLEDFVIHGE